LFFGEPDADLVVNQLTPQELAVLLPAFNKIAQAFDVYESPETVGFKSGILNDIIYSLPQLREPLKVLMGAVSLKHAAEGRKDAMWNDPDRYPGISDADLVYCYFSNPVVANDNDASQAIQSVEIELLDELKASTLPFFFFISLVYEICQFENC
jgi:DNA mismatch repair protein MSH3